MALLMVARTETEQLPGGENGWRKKKKMRKNGDPCCHLSERALSEHIALSKVSVQGLSLGQDLRGRVKAGMSNLQAACGTAHLMATPCHANRCGNGSSQLSGPVQPWVYTRCSQWHWLG